MSNNAYLFAAALWAAFAVGLLVGCFLARKSTTRLELAGPPVEPAVRLETRKVENITCEVTVFDEEMMTTDAQIIGGRISQQLRENLGWAVWKYVRVDKSHNPQLMKTRFRASLTVVDRDSCGELKTND